MKMRGSTLIIGNYDNSGIKKKTEKEENICICKVVITTKVASSD